MTFPFAQPGPNEPPTNPAPTNRPPTRQHPPTAEQHAAITAFTTGNNLVIEAGAGTGKTSTLRMLAATKPRRGTYIAYNRAIAADARGTFPPTVTCATAHSLAFRALGHQYAHRLNGPRTPARETARLLHITQTIKTPTGRLLTPAQQARLVTDTITRFCHSAAPEIGPWHVPHTPGLDDPPTITMLRETLLPLARRMWDDLNNPAGRCRFAHDHYLKMWQLTAPALISDYVLLDEAQDANPVIAHIVTTQPAQQILVGDRAQAIYGWRGARDAMATFNAHRLPLTRSFRFGPEIADEANKWLSILDTPLRLTGHTPITSTIGPLNQPHAVLCRSNAETIRQAIHALRTNRRPAIVGGGTEIRRLAEAAANLKAGRGCTHPELYAFKTWGEVQEYVAQDTDGSDLKTFVGIVDDYGPERIIEIVDQLAAEPHADVIISTAHKAKGREWSSVKIAGDFPEPKNTSDDDGVPDVDAMLAYVAVTRARHHLDRGALTWIDKHL